MGNTKATQKNDAFPTPSLASLHKSLLFYLYLMSFAKIFQFLIPPCTQPQPLLFPTQALGTSYATLLAVPPRDVVFPYASVTFTAMSFCYSYLLSWFELSIAFRAEWDPKDSCP